jgi:type I restriction enzyme S subunit
MTEHQTTIGEIAEIFDGPHATPKKIDAGPYFLSISSLVDGRLNLSKSAFLSEESFVKWTKRVTPQKDDLLFSYETRLGQAALMPSGIRACLGRRMGLLRPNLNKVHPQYLLYAYLSPHFQQVILRNTVTGATVDRISLSEMADFPINIPPLSEQKVVADLLESIDKKIELNSKINAALEDMVKLIYDYWFVQFDFPDCNGKPYKLSGGKMVYNEELKREIPDGWKVKTLNELSSRIGDGIHGTPQYVDESEFSFINGNNLKKGFIYTNSVTKKVSAEEYDKYFIKLDKNTILISINGTLGNLAVYAGEKVMLGKSSAYINCLEEHRAFCYQYLKQSHVQKNFWNIATGSTIKNLSLKSLNNLKLSYPNKELIINFNNLVNPIDDKRESIFKENNRLIELREWLLPMLMSGQVTIKG